MHWRAVYFNRKRAECCFFDSLVSEPTEDVMRGIKMIMKKIDDPLYFKFKINRIKLQADNTATCGAFDAGKIFKEATRFTDKHVDGEKGIRRYFSKWGRI